MRRNLLPSAQRVVTGARNDIARQSSTAPFICADCRRAALRITQVAQTDSRRTFRSATRRSEQAFPSSTTTTPSNSHQREAILPQTHYDLFPSTFPDGPPPQSPFSPDLRQLRKEYLQLQAKSHPDLAPQDRKRHAEAVSMRLNEAYKTLQDPLRRARYLLAIQGVDMEDESAQLADDELLMEVMELREQVDEVENEEELLGIRQENEERIAQSVGVLEEAFKRGNMEKATEEAVRLRYWTNVEESIQGWEKGQGGGPVHH